MSQDQPPPEEGGESPITTRDLGHFDVAQPHSVCYVTIALMQLLGCAAGSTLEVFRNMLQTTSHGSRHRFRPDRRNYRTMSTVKEKPRKRTRAKAPRVRTGCKTCKIRHLKCDEGKPHCHRCEKDSRVCDGYEVIQARKSKARKSEFPPRNHRPSQYGTEKPPWPRLRLPD